MARPRKYPDAKSLQKAIDRYFEELDETTPPTPPTMSGMVMSLGFDNRHTLYKLANHPILGTTTKKAMNRIENHYERLLTRPCNNGGAIFWLKQRHSGWTDQVDITSGGEKMTAQVIVSGTPIATALEAAKAEINGSCTKDEQGI